MAHYTYVVLTNPVSGREAEYNDWYDNQHLADVLNAPGFVAARRFRIADRNDNAPHRYLALYEIESDDVQRTLAGLFARAGTPDMVLSDAMDQNYSAVVYEAITERRVAKSRD